MLRTSSAVMVTLFFALFAGSSGASAKDSVLVVAQANPVTTDTLAETGGIESTEPLLGRGFTPHLYTVEEAVVMPNDRPTALKGATSNVSYGLVANSEYLERAIAADASVSVAGQGWGFSAQSSMKSRYEENRNQVSFAATVQVIRGTKNLVSPIQMDQGAIALLTSDPKRYLRVYGTSVIDSVGFGGAAVILFTFNFNSVEEAMEFSLQAEGNYGMAKGGLSVSISELMKKSSNNVSVSGFVTGTNDLPEFFGSSLTKDGDTRASFYSVEFSEGMLSQILTYLDEFPEKIKNAPESQLSQVDFTARNIMRIGTAGSIPVTSEKTIRDAVALGEQLDRDQTTLWGLRKQLWRMKTELAQFNTAANLKEADRILDLIDDVEDQIESRREALKIHSDLDSSSAFVDDRVEVFPKTFCTSQPSKDQSPVLRGVQAHPTNRPNKPATKDLVYWDYFVEAKDPDVTYAVVAGAAHGHSRTDPGCNNGILEVREIPLDSPMQESAEARQPWEKKKDMSVMQGETVVRGPMPFASCRGQGDLGFNTEAFAFSAEETRSVRVLYTNYDDPGYNSTWVDVYKCGQ